MSGIFSQIIKAGDLIWITEILVALGFAWQLIKGWYSIVLWGWNHPWLNDIRQTFAYAIDEKY